MVTKEILNQYIDLKKEIEETREKIEKNKRQIEKLEREGNVVDSVAGGKGGIEHFKIEGFPYPEYSRKKTLLYSRQTTLTNLELELMEIVNQIELFIASVDDSLMRRIINLRFIEKMPWNKVADRIGGANTEDSVRKSFERFMKQN